eukprot:1488778-Rhodomonas_salina.2
MLTMTRTTRSTLSLLRDVAPLPQRPFQTQLELRKRELPSTRNRWHDLYIVVSVPYQCVKSATDMRHTASRPQGGA